MTTITQEVPAWLTEYSSVGPEELKDPSLIRLDQVRYTTYDMSEMGWTRFGTATITLEIPTLDAVIDAKVSALRAEITKTQADAVAKVAALEGQIANLLALPCEVQA